MPENLMDPITGLSDSKLSQATASASDVLSGKTFYAGDKEIKTGSMAKGSLKVVDLGGINCWGGGGSINVKSKLPSIYSSLTAKNFYVEPVSSWLCYGGMEPNDTGDYSWNFSKSYNASTGILSISQMGATVWAGHAHGGLKSAKAYCVYVG